VISVIVPAYNGTATLPRVLRAISESEGVTWECVVVDDGSTDGTASLAESWGARVIRAGDVPSGPARARNLGAAMAQAELICFIDADVVVGPTTLANFVGIFKEDPELAAAFGSYDDQPEAQGWLSQYRNLVHHYVHQTGKPAASTFWAGCGAIRRSVFLECGGFDPAYRRPSIEDIELGYRLVGAGRRIRLVREIQVKHLKRWTLRGIVMTDVFDRALPWSTLIRSSGNLPNDLNLTYASRASGVSVYVFIVLVVLGVYRRAAWCLLPAPLAVLLACNQDLYRFFLAKRGVQFSIGAIAMHWLYYGYSTLAFAVSLAPEAVRSRLEQWVARKARRPFA
jgi:glycosyltransferase involved in cell wall biosynthesis